MQNNLIDHLPIIFAGVGAALFILWVLLRKKQTPPEIHRIPTERSLATVGADTEVIAGLCRVCGVPATNPTPTFARKRGVFVESTPEYVQLSRKTDPPTLCELHAHVAAMMMDEFITQEVHVPQSQLNKEIATKMATFERVTLFKRIEDSLSAEERRRVRQVQDTNVLQFPKATDGTAKEE